MQLGKLSSDSNHCTVTVELGEVPIRHMMNLFNLPAIDGDDKDMYKRLTRNIAQYVGAAYLIGTEIDADNFTITFKVNHTRKSEFTKVVTWISTYLSVRADIPMEKPPVYRGG